jgi:hypothetical protein
MLVKRYLAWIGAHPVGLRSACSAVLVIAVASLGGCGSEDGGLEVGPDPAEAALVSCGTGGTTFPRSALDRLHEAPPPDGEMADGMQSFLGSEEGVFWPQDGWRVLSSSDGVAVLLADADSQLWFQTLELSAGSWRWTGSSASEECPLRVPAPADYNAVVWRLDPDRESPTPSSTAIEVLVHETACASGEPVGDRLVGPDVDVTASEVRFGFLAEAQDGDHTCPSNPETPITIQLEEPLGDRELVDAYELGTDLRDYF